jgi:NAD(P)H-hydrate epimerase
VLGSAVLADHTVTFAHHKLGLLTPSGAQQVGKLHLADIGVPTSIASELSAQLLDRGDIVSWLEPRAVGAYKNTAGHVAVLAGSPGKIGAGLMVARACLRGGAGLVTIATWPESASAMESRVLEAMTARLDPNDLPASLDHALAGKRVVVVGPGFGLDERARKVVTRVLANHPGPVVVDADALTLFAKNPSGFAVAKKAVLTPHPGELARILGTSTQAVEADRFAAARTAAEKTRAVVLLKGVHTLIATPDGRIAINPTGNAALATAGAGDVLSGILGALAGILEPFEAACTAAYVHGMAADIWRAEGADRGLLASEIADLLPRVFAPLVAEHTPWPV